MESFQNYLQIKTNIMVKILNNGREVNLEKKNIWKHFRVVQIKANNFNSERFHWWKGSNSREKQHTQKIEKNICFFYKLEK